MAERVVGYLKRRAEGARQARALGLPMGSWLLGELGREATRFASKLEARSVSAKLTASLSTSRRLNFGCGYDRRDGFLNVDSDPACRPDVLVSQHSLEAFPRGFYEAIVAKDVLEHVPRTKSQHLLLHFADWLQVGGLLELQTSSILGVADLLQRRRDFEFHYGMTNCLFGTQAHPGDFHFTGFTDVTLKVMLHACGYSFGDFELVDGWMFKLEARKLRDWYQWGDQSPSLDAFGREVFDAALGRAIKAEELQGFRESVDRLGRRGAAFEVFTSHEHLLHTARAHGFA